MSAILDNLDLYRQGFLTTLALAVVSAAIALVLGTLLAAMRVSPAPTLRAAGTVYVQIVRNTPLTVAPHALNATLRSSAPASQPDGSVITR